MIAETDMGFGEVVVSARNRSSRLIEKIEKEESERHKNESCCQRPVPGSKNYQLFLSYLSVGIVYGDIGTSPLYTFSSIFPNNNTLPTEENTVGALSLILWTMLLITALKYLVFVLLGDDNGEGGTFALYSNLSRSFRARLKDRPDLYKKINSVLASIAIVGVSAILSDGILTPSISVLGAIQGLTLISPSITSSVVVGITCAILFFFFLIQRIGTSKVSFMFSPVLLVWFCALAGIGIYNISLYPSVLRAFPLCKSDRIRIDLCE